MATYKRICAWCNPPSVIEVIAVPDNDPMAGQTTHGICRPCADKNFPAIQGRRILADKAEEVLRK